MSLSTVIFISLLLSACDLENSNNLPGIAIDSRRSISKLEEEIPLAEKPGNFDFCAKSFEVSVSDGDTIELMASGIKRRIRLIGIDTPELGQNPYGERAGSHLRNIIKNTSSKEEVCCNKGQEPLDKYGRTLAYCWYGNTFINAEMILSGNAFAFFVGDKNNYYKNMFFDLEEEAEQKGLGVHNPENPLPELPSEWRRNNRRK
ncbi:MAG: thermonuclease family protein [Candidatus Caenarcaniphilales bacterium]|nr:thermonuclease family protein [Candidatus Caenarcaniphilales bacterium]